MSIIRFVYTALSLLLCLLFLPLAVAPPLSAGEDIEKIQQFISEPIFNGQVYYYESGLENSEILVLLHGVGDEASTIWEPLLPELVGKYHVLALDLPGFGKSTQANLLYSPENYSAFLYWFIGKHAKGPVHLMGHSLGGALALRFAADHPDKVKRLILVDSIGILHRIAFSKKIMEFDLPLDNWPEIIAAPLQEAIDSINDFTGSTAEKMTKQGSAEDISKILSTPVARRIFLRGKSNAIAALAVTNHDFSNLLDMVTCETLLIWGENDNISPVRTGKVLDALLPHASLVIIPRAGHVPMNDRRDDFLTALFAESLPKKTQRPVSYSKTGRVGSCFNQSGMKFSGVYDRIELDQCKDVRISNVSTEYIAAKDSEIKIENSTITGKAIGLDLNNSKLTGTALTITGDIAIHADKSRLDLAGVTLIGKKYAVTSDDQAILLFSVSRITSLLSDDYIHGVRKVSPDSPL
ncbi:MAG: alpha/beta hydrolase [Proteobacteria bacterium]|nr:alpha/beta hydrolase [Pseudomonadota bacterium]MBU1709299.1 alpha/beta hydrolase [Pseudomonadota bacterium]